MLDFGQVLAVVRMDAGDGHATHPYVFYHAAISRDGGRSVLIRWRQVRFDLTWPWRQIVDQAHAHGGCWLCATAAPAAGGQLRASADVRGAHEEQRHR
jgi:hypothetical protein